MRRIALIAASYALLAPAPALAAPVETTVPAVLGIGVGVVGLLTAVVLMLLAVALQRVSDGAAIAENMSYVLAGVVCLAASVLVNWVSRLAPDLAPDVARLGSDLLVIASMAFLGIYFYLVRRAMLRFLTAATGLEILAQAHADVPGDDADG